MAIHPRMKARLEQTLLSRVGTLQESYSRALSFMRKIKIHLSSLTGQIDDATLAPLLIECDGILHDLNLLDGVAPSDMVQPLQKLTRRIQNFQELVSLLKAHG